MSRLSLAVLGTFEAFLDTHPLHFRGWKERALLAYLATESESLHERSQLVALLWSNMTEAQGLTNLRLTLSRLRQTLRDMDVGGFITVTRTGLRWNPAAPTDVDIHTFRRAIEPPIVALRELSRGNGRTATGALPSTLLNPQTIAALRKAVALYRGDFLTGFDGENEELFVEWSRAWRERLHQEVLSALYTLTEVALQEEDYALAEQYAFRQVGLERWREEAHRQLMRALASTGQRTAALRQFDTLENVLAEELGVSPDSASVALYHQIRDGKYALPPVAEAAIPQFVPTPVLIAPRPIEVSVRPPNNLFKPMTPFMGRETEQAFVLNRIQERDERFVTLLGEGGIGKSRLANALGHQLLPRFPQGVWWVSLAELEPNPAQPEEALIDCIARTFNLPLSGQENAATQVFAYLQHKKVLLILDNFETIYEAAPTVLGLLERCPQVAVLVTTREALHYQAEIVLRVEGLPQPPTADPDPLTYSSMRLLVERAERTGWHLNPQQVDAIAELCRFLRGVPLALELAATLVGELPLPALLQDLQKGYDLLATSMRDVPSRHRTMQAIFETSWELLPPRLQVILAQLAIFRGRFDTDAARAIAFAEPIDLMALVAKSLVRQDSDGYFSLHDHLRDFAQRQWQHFVATANGQSKVLRESPARHAAYYLGWLARAEDELYGDALPATLTAIQSQRANLYQGWQWALQQKAWNLIAPAISPLRRALHIMADLRDGVRLFEAVVSARPKKDELYLEAVAAMVHFMNRMGQTVEALEWVTSALAHPDLPPTRHADLLRLHADILLSGEQVNRTDAIYQQALSLAQRVEDRRLETIILVAACGGAWLRNDYPYAQRYADAALPLAREVGDLWAEVSVLNRLGVLSINQYHGLSAAHDYFNRGLELARRLNDRQTEGTILGNLGIVSEYEMDFAGALAAYQGGLALQTELGNQQATALSYTNVGRLLYLIGEYESARVYIETALRLYIESNNLRGQGLASIYLGALLNNLGEFHSAQQHLEESSRIFRTLDLIAFLPFSLTYLGDTFYRWGDYERAEALLTEAAHIRRDIRDTILLKDTLAILVRLYLTQKRYDLLPPLLAELQENMNTTGDAGAEHLITDYIALYEGQRAIGDPAAPETIAYVRNLFAQVLAQMPNEAMRNSYRAIPAHQLLASAEKKIKKK